MQSQRRRFFPSRFDEIKDFEDGRKALLLATIPLVDKRDDDDDEEHPRVWQGRRVSKTPIIIYIYVCVKSPTPQKGEEKVTKSRRYFYSKKEENQHLSRASFTREKEEMTKPKERRSRTRLVSLSSSIDRFFVQFLTVNACVCVDILPFFNNKSRGKERYF
jgi:hypothetical protein